MLMWAYVGPAAGFILVSDFYIIYIVIVSCLDMQLGHAISGDSAIGDCVALVRTVLSNSFTLSHVIVSISVTLDHALLSDSAA